MTKRELLDRISSYDDDAVVVIVGPDDGWCNIGGVKQVGSEISFEMDFSRPF
jgi:hypothetical protein